MEFMCFVQKKGSVTFNFLGANFLSCQSGYCHKSACNTNSNTVSEMN